jgi:biopolymer transport protein ExbD
VAKADFSSAFSQIYNPNNPKPVFVRAEGDLPYQDIITALDVLRQAGALDIGLATQPAKPR